MRFSRPATDMVGYATTGRVYKCWWCDTEVVRVHSPLYESLERGLKQAINGEYWSVTVTKEDDE